jgi:hypothetical protein
VVPLGVQELLPYFPRPQMLYASWRKMLSDGNHCRVGNAPANSDSTTISIRYAIKFIERSVHSNYVAQVERTVY